MGAQPKCGQWVVKDETLNRGGKKGSLGRIVERLEIRDGEAVATRSYSDQLCEIQHGRTSEYFR